MRDLSFRKRVVVISLGLLSVLAVFFSISVGSIYFTISDIIDAFISSEQTNSRLLIVGLRLPRTLCAGLCGVCLALSGCILQGVMHNRMASPSTIGVTSGAGLVGYLTLVVFPNSFALLPLGTILGALATTLLIYLLAFRSGVDPIAMILSGMAISALFGAISDAAKTFFADTIGNASGFLVGGFSGTTWNDFLMIIPYTSIGVIFCLLSSRRMNILTLGDESASSLGLNVEVFRFAMIVVSSLLSGAAISIGGLISFVGLIVPHIARLLVGPDYRALCPTSALLGFTLVVVCDTLGRVIMPPGEVPVSIILSLIGAPFFIILLRNRTKGGLT